MTALPGTPQAPEHDVPAGSVAWSEVVSPDPVRTGAFYARLFGWDLRAPSSAGTDDFTFLRHGHTMVAGLSRKVNADVPPGWLFSFRVADIDAAAARVSQLGGATITGIMTIPNNCRFAVAQEPTGATFALLQAIPRNRAPSPAGWKVLGRP
jgi:predicted enzyme related to lactoylglutathione lyase